MATAVIGVQQRKVDEILEKDQAEFIPDLIEESRKDADGRQVITKYARGKLLGKVCQIAIFFFESAILHIDISII